MTKQSEPDHGEVERVARGLSEAGRTCVLHNRLDGGLRYGWRKSGSASCALERRGVLAEGQDSIGNIVWRLTPLGLAVRNFILSEGGHE